MKVREKTTGPRKSQEQYEKIRYTDLDLDSLNGFQSKPGTVISNSANTAPINRFRTSQTSDAQRYPFASIGCCVYVTLQPQLYIYICIYIYIYIYIYMSRDPHTPPPTQPDGSPPPLWQGRGGFLSSQADICIL